MLPTREPHVACETENCLMNVFVGAVIDVEGLGSGDRGRVQSSVREPRNALRLAVGMRSEYRCGGMRDPLTVYMDQHHLFSDSRDS